MIRKIKQNTRKAIEGFTLAFDQAIAGSALKQLSILFLSFILVYAFWLLVAWISFRHTDNLNSINNEIDSFWWGIIAQMLDPGNLHMAGKPGSGIIALRWVVLLVTFSGSIVFSGLLISTFTHIFEQRVHKVKSGRMNYRYNQHYCILGYHKQAPGLISQILKETQSSHSKIVILTEKNPEELRLELLSEFTAKEMHQVYLLSGDRTSALDLNRSWVHEAKKIYLLGEDEETGHDSRNIASLNMINEICGKKQTKTKPCCLVLFESQTTNISFQYSDNIFNNIEIHSVNYFEQWAKTVFLSTGNGNMVTFDLNKPAHQNPGELISKLDIEPAGIRITRYSPLDFEPITVNSDKFVHLIIIGTTRMGFALATEAIRIAHFANYRKKKTRITLIDENIDRNKDFFASRFQSLYKAVDVVFHDIQYGTTEVKTGDCPFININLEFIKGRVESEPVRNKLLDWTNNTDALCTIAICLNNPDTALAAGLYLPDEIYQRRNKILIQQDTEHSILSYIDTNQKKTENKFSNIRIFGMTDRGIDWQATRSFKAMAVNHFYASSYQHPTIFSTEDLQTMKANWNNLAERHKWSSRNNAESISVKMRALYAANQAEERQIDAIDDKTIELLAEIEHARWNADALLSGFYPASPTIQQESTRTANLIWNEIQTNAGHQYHESVTKLKMEHELFVKEWKRQMIHPCIVPYDDLSEYYKEIDRRLARAIPVIEAEDNRLQSFDWNTLTSFPKS